MDGEWVTVGKKGKKKAHVPPPKEEVVVKYDEWGCDICDEIKKNKPILESITNQLASRDAHNYAMAVAS